ncbi:uncharacterized protein BJX67DRAFT_366586 [Aspergillus lucknowensis]|uniref:Secreted protein n=1 Tax=Aspergillus lucknowensis TaxID=176173 RepID=A0ABR4LCT2_9EURO
MLIFYPITICICARTAISLLDPRTHHLTTTTRSSSLYTRGRITTFWDQVLICVTWWLIMLNICPSRAREGVHLLILRDCGSPSLERDTIVVYRGYVQIALAGCEEICQLCGGGTE